MKVKAVEDRRKKMFDDNSKSLFYRAWTKLILAYLASFALSFMVGIFLIKILKTPPEALFEISTRRLSFAFPVFETGSSLGIDQGVLLFIWNSLGSLVTISFLYTAALFNPRDISLFPKTLRKALCGKNKMKLLCFLPGCRAIENEPIRRLYVWLMVPWLGMLLLGMESGLTVSTSAGIFGSYLAGFISLLPHGVIEIPAIAFGGAAAFGAHLLVRKNIGEKGTAEIFEEVERYKEGISPAKIILIVISSLLVAGLIEGHLTEMILDSLL